MRFVPSEPPVPEGLRYLPDWISLTEEQELLTHITALSFAEVRMHGVVAKRRVVHFGWDYGYESWKIAPTDPIPAWLMPLRERAAAIIEAPPTALEEVLVSRYEPGAGIGWHRDAPMFGPMVIGVSLVGSCRMRFQRTRGKMRETADCILAPRSAYVLSGAARVAWKHCRRVAELREPGYMFSAVVTVPELSRTELPPYWPILRALSHTLHWLYPGCRLERWMPLRSRYSNHHRGLLRIGR